MHAQMSVQSGFHWVLEGKGAYLYQDRERDGLRAEGLAGCRGRPERMVHCASKAPADLLSGF